MRAHWSIGVSRHLSDYGQVATFPCKSGSQGRGEGPRFGAFERFGLSSVQTIHALVS